MGTGTSRCALCLVVDVTMTSGASAAGEQHDEHSPGDGVGIVGAVQLVAGAS